MSLVAWLLVTNGVTTIVTMSTLFRPVREGFSRLVGEKLGNLLGCSMCFGFWVGVLVSLLGLPTPGLPASWPPWLTSWASGAASSFACFFLHLLLVLVDNAGFLLSPQNALSRGPAKVELHLAPIGRKRKKTSEADENDQNERTKN